MFIDNSAPRVRDLKSVPPAQRKTERKKADLTITQAEYVESIVKGINQIFDSHIVPSDAKADLVECLRLLTSTDPMPFEWDTTMYESTMLAQPNTHVARLNLRDNAYDDLADRQEIKEYSLDTEDSRGNRRPDWVPGQCYLMHVEYEPFWAIGRYFCRLFF